MRWEHIHFAKHIHFTEPTHRSVGLIEISQNPDVGFMLQPYPRYRQFSFNNLACTIPLYNLI